MIKFDKNECRKIMVFKFGGIGDYVIMLPLFESLRKNFSASQIWAIAAPPGKEILEKSGLVDKCIISKVLYKQGLESIFSLKVIKDVINIRKQLAPPYDLYIDCVSKFSLTGTLKPWLVDILCKPVVSAGLNCEGRAFYLDVKVEDNRDLPRHNIYRYCDILKAIGIDSGFALPFISPSSGQLAKAMEFFVPYAGRLKICLHCGARKKFFNQKAWPLERFAALAGKLASEDNAVVFATGSEEEIPLVQKLRSMASCEIIPVPPENDIYQFCAVISCFDYFISNDTGPMHLAVAMRVPTVGIFGRADYESYGAYPEDVPFSAVTLSDGKKYGNAPNMDDPRGLKNISVDMVYEHFKKLREYKK